MTWNNRAASNGVDVHVTSEQRQLTANVADALGSVEVKPTSLHDSSF